MPSRSDLVDDPDLVSALVLARRGTAYFSRKLGELTDDDYDGPSLLPGWSRRQVIAHVGYNARAVARLVEWARTGIENPMYSSTEQRNTEIDYGATLNSAALRNLHHHSVVALNVEWRDLPAGRWTTPVRTIQGRTVPVSETIWMRTREVWLHAVDLDNGGSFTDFPLELVDRLLADVKASWERQGVGADITLEAIDRPTQVPGRAGDAPGSAPIIGTAAQLARWATGRGRTPPASPDTEATPPRWL